MVQHHRSSLPPAVALRPKTISETVLSTSRYLLRPFKLTTILFLLLSVIYITLLLLAPSYPSKQSPCSICCDTSSPRSDVCFMHGPVATDQATNSLFLLNASKTLTEYTIKPYTRKWEPTTMATIDQLRLRGTLTFNSTCEVNHSVPAVVFSTGGYTGNVYHEFNDGILPMYITAQKYNRKVVFVLLEYHDWWVSKYHELLQSLSEFEAIDFSGDKRVHCFPEAIVGLMIHDELSIDEKMMEGNKTIFDFRRLLDEAYRPRVKVIEAEEIELGKKDVHDDDQPKLVILSRNGSRAMENEAEVVQMAEDVGFKVEVLQPRPETELAKIYMALNSCDAMVGVHGAAMTHFLFMRPGSVFIQVVPLGTEWAAEAYYGAPAARMGLKYVRYKVEARESSLYREYAKDDKVLRNPESVNGEGWEVTKRVYLDGQKVRIHLGRFRKRLVKAYQYSIGKRLKQR